MSSQLAFHVDLSSCIGCKACQIACIDKHDLQTGQLWRRVYEYSGGDWVQKGNAYINSVFTYYVSIGCQHCEDPICVEVCPTRAMHKREDGIVLVDTQICVGCRYCQWACPYGAPQYDPSIGKMGKCNFCYDFIDEGKPPACVAACPMRAMDYGTLEEMIAKYGDLRELAPLPASDITNPSSVYTPNRATLPSGATQGEIANTEEVWVNEPGLIGKYQYKG
jgi:anaerobic dimethyl sulfoxide reductase subunit B (iron-sulfur subunit)